MAYIDVIIPVYNCKKYLRKTIKSVFSQSYQDIRILLVDDGSTDGSSQLCDDIARQLSVDKCLVLHQVNRGVSCARNSGIRKAIENDDAGYIAFLDADDFWMENVLTEGFIQKVRLEQADLVAMGSVTCDEESELFESPIIYKNKITDGGEKIIWDFKSHFGSIFYKKRFLVEKNIRFFENLKYSEDKIFLQQSAALAKKIYFVNSVIYGYRKNRQSAMEKQTKLAAIDYYIPIINGWIQSDEFINEHLLNNGYTAGKTLAGIYFLDMISEHCMQHRKIDEVRNVCNEHPQYDLFLNMQPENVNSKQYAEHNLFLRHPIKFVIKYNIIGLLKYNARRIVYLKGIYHFYRKRRYPYKKEDLNKVLNNLIT